MATQIVAKFDPSVYDPTEPIHTVILAFKICGIWPINYRFRKLYLVYGFLFQFVFTFAFCGFKLLNFYFKTNMDLVTVIIFETVAEISCWVRVINFVGCFDRILDCLNVIKSFKFRNEEELSFYKIRLRLFTHVMRFYLGCASFACFFSLFAPFLSDKPILPYPVWYPLDWQNNVTHYWIAYTYQFVGIMFLAHTLVMLETYHIFLLVTMGAHVDILAKRLQDIGSMYLHLPHDARQKQLLIFFEDNIKIFEVISRLIDSVESIFDIQFFYQFICSALIFCVTAFKIMTTNISEEIVSVSFYLSFSATMMNEIFLPCYFGNELTLKREKLSLAIYSSQWIDLSLKFKKTMIIFLEGLKRVRILKSGKIFTLTLNSFLTVINRSYSLFAVLRNFIK